MIFKHEHLTESKLYEFIQFIAGFASAFIAINLYYDVAAREEDTKQDLMNKNVSLVNDLWLAPTQELSKNFDNLGSMPAEMFPQVTITNREDMDKLVMAMRIFQTLENYKVIYERNPRELTLWLRHYLQWAQSPTLQQLWPKLMHNYKPDTVVFVEFLFKYANELKNTGLTSQDYINMANLIRNDARAILS